MKRVALLILLTTWTGLTWHRAGAWASNLSLWRSAVQVTPCLPRVHANLSRALEGIDPIAADREQATAVALATEGKCVVLR